MIDNLIQGIVKCLVEIEKDRLFPRDRRERMLDEKDPKKLGENIVKLAVEDSKKDTVREHSFNL